MQRWLLALAIAVAALPARSAFAEPSAIAVLGVEIAGDAAPELRPRVAESIAAGLAKADRNVVGLDAVREQLAEAPELIGCTSTACLERIAERTGARDFVRARLRADGATYTLELELFVADDDEDALADKLRADCTVCTMTELFEWVGATSAELLVPDETASAEIVVYTDPPGATVEVGGRPVGAAPTQARLPVGHHDITARLEGHNQAVTTVRVKEGDPGPHEVKLVLIPHDDRGNAGQATFGPWKWVTAGGAAASVATSAVLFAMHGSPTCEPEPPQTQCPRELDGVTPGLVGLGVGAVLGGVSGWMFYRDASGRTATVSAGPGGGQVSVRF